MLRLATVAAVARLVVGQEPGNSLCPCVSAPSWVAGATSTSGGSQVLQSTVGSSTTAYPITYGLDGCQAYSATHSPSCVDLDTGVALTRRPAWCEDKWCYVDEDRCEVAGGAITSTLFPDAHVSYQTCASAAGVSTNSYEHLAEVGSGVTELTAIVENYLYASAAEAERVAAATSTTSYQRCDASMACPCTRCEESDDWHCSGIVDFKSANLYYRTEDCPPSGCDDTASANQMKCMAGRVGNIFTRVADKEMGEDTSRIGFQMFADQDSGGLLNWPSVHWCHKDDYDPRFRPWYSQSASGPKDVVIVIDVSGSMGRGNRISMAKDAVSKVIDTLTWSDHVSLILFDDSALTYDCNGRIMCAMTSDEKDRIKTWAEQNIRPMGGTNFDAAFAEAFEALRSGSTSACSKAILFMTDGESNVDYTFVRQNAVAYGARVMTYALGDGAEPDVCRQLACENGGVFTAVGDDDDLALAMASYYKIFAAGMSRADQCRITWSNYMGGVTPVEFLSACLPIFKTQPGEATCGGASGTPGSPDTDEYAELLGTVCMDLSILADLSKLKQEGEWDSWYQSNVIDASCTCPSITLSHAQLQAVRASIPGAQMCDTTMHATYDNTARSHTGGRSTCGEGIVPVDGPVTCGMRTGLVIAIVAAIVVGCICSVCAVCAMARLCCGRSKKKPQKEESQPENSFDQPVPTVTAAPLPPQQEHPPGYGYGGGIPTAQAVPVQSQPVGGPAEWRVSTMPPNP